MTIEIYGHVQALEHAGEQVLVRIQVEASRMRAGRPFLSSFGASGFLARGDAPTIEIFAMKGEVDSYKPGMGVCIQVRPHAAPPKGLDRGVQLDLLVDAEAQAVIDSVQEYLPCEPHQPG